MLLLRKLGHWNLILSRTFFIARKWQGTRRLKPWWRIKDFCFYLFSLWHLEVHTQMCVFELIKNFCKLFLWPVGIPVKRFLNISMKHNRMLECSCSNHWRDKITFFFLFALSILQILFSGDRNMEGVESILSDWWIDWHKVAQTRLCCLLVLSDVTHPALGSCFLAAVVTCTVNAVLLHMVCKMGWPFLQ